ncbi:restriction endonuclease subunit S [Tolypothrix sp. VBCCA 56010]|uniref:restriction endonuclease subunit S n=1 Tax=Tolypothrix sp. VBCCA 56010 TaxID=3137731 RepID=UPI003D7C97FF
MEWKTIEFQNLYAESSRNGLYKSKEFHGTVIRIVNMKELFAFPLIGEQEMQLLDVTDTELNKFGLQTGDLLFARRSLVEEGSGKCVLVVEHKKSPIVFESSIIRVRLNKNHCLPLFYYYYFRSPTGRLGIQSIITGAGQKGIRGSELAKVIVYHPPVTEQKAIAQSLSDVDALITECDRIITKKRNTKQGTMQELLTGKKRLPGFSGEWEVKKFDNLTKLITCGLAATPKYVREEIGKPFLSAQNVRNGKVVYDNYRFISYELFDQITKYSKPQKGDLLYTRVGAGIGEAGVIEDNFEFGIYVSLTLIRTDKNQLHNYFLLHLLNSPTYKSIAKNGQFAGGGVQNLNVQIVKEFSISLPPLPEQKAIAQILSDMDTEIAALEQKRDKYKAIKQGMMQELLTGKTRLVDSDRI